ncbi:hypothetical protein TWF281_011246 [Arthrobotrys megalospora]
MEMYVATVNRGNKNISAMLGLLAVGTDVARTASNATTANASPPELPSAMRGTNARTILGVVVLHAEDLGIMGIPAAGTLLLILSINATLERHAVAVVVAQRVGSAQTASVFQKAFIDAQMVILVAIISGVVGIVAVVPVPMAIHVAGAHLKTKSISATQNLIVVATAVVRRIENASTANACQKAKIDAHTITTSAPTTNGAAALHAVARVQLGSLAAGALFAITNSCARLTVPVVVMAAQRRSSNVARDLRRLVSAFHAPKIESVVAILAALKDRAAALAEYAVFYLGLTQASYHGNTWVVIWIKLARVF